MSAFENDRFVYEINDGINGADLNHNIFTFFLLLNLQWFHFCLLYRSKKKKKRIC